jgi:hypothetical protein
MWLNLNQIILGGFSCPFEITGAVAPPLNRIRRPTALITPGGRTQSARSGALWASFACQSADKNETRTMIAVQNRLNDAVDCANA